MSKKPSINDIIQSMTDSEEEKTKMLFNLTKTIKTQGYITKDQAIEILKWKSHRPLKHYNKNSDKDFKQITRLAFEQKDEKIRMHILTALTGVKYPAASALLMLYNRTRYPIIDI